MMTARPHFCFQSSGEDFIESNCPPNYSGSRDRAYRPMLTARPHSCLQSQKLDFIDIDCPLNQHPRFQAVERQKSCRANRRGSPNEFHINLRTPHTLRCLLTVMTDPTRPMPRPRPMPTGASTWNTSITEGRLPEIVFRTPKRFRSHPRILS